MSGRAVLAWVTAMSEIVVTGLLKGVELDRHESPALTFASHADTGLVGGGKMIVAWKPCGCWRVNLEQGVLVLPCAVHQPGVLAVIGETAT